MYQHGDVLFKAVNSIPITAKKKKREGFLIVAEGESTGHAHRIEEDCVSCFLDGEEMYIESEKAFTVRHEEHNPITINPGKYYIGIIREFDHFEELERRVVD